MADDTPPDELPAIGHGHGHGVPDLVWMWEFRREMQAAHREMRKEQAAAMNEVRTRLSAIEGRQNEGSHTLEKHSAQIIELTAETAEIELRLRRVEVDGAPPIARRLAVVEDQAKSLVEQARDVRAAVAATANSLPARMLAAFATATAAAFGPLVVGLLLWLLVTYAKAAPAIGVTAP